LSPAKLNGWRSRAWLLGLLVLAGCAHQSPRNAAVGQLGNGAPVAPVAQKTAQKTAHGTPAEAEAAQATAQNPMTAGAVVSRVGPDAQGSSSAAIPDSALPGPPADSLVTANRGDLFDRLRGGFLLQEVDQPAIDSELNWFANHPDYLERTFSRSELWLYYIVGQLEARNMPRELALLPVIESAFEPYAYSRARASGLWQFISDTGRRFGLRQDWWYDGRRDPIAATRAALDYLQELHDEFSGDWLLAIAAYNCGELAVSRAIERNQRAGKPTDFWHLKLPTETRGYVPELLAMRRLVADPARYGLEFSHIPNQPYFVPVATGGQIDLQVVAQIANISPEELYELNPAFHRWATDPAGPDQLLVPVDVAPGLQEALAALTPDQRLRVDHYTVHRGDTVASIARHFATSPEVVRALNDLGPKDPLVIEATLRVPGGEMQLPEKAARAAMLVDSPQRSRHHVRQALRVVRTGDTLYGIAQRMGTDVNTIAQLNGLNPGDPLRTGQKLRVAPPDVSEASPAPTTTAHPARSASSTAVASADGRRVTYIVRAGDTLYSIARLLQVTVIDLVSWNSVAPRHNLRPGQTLIAFVRTRS
jgi:membrane-bound lytic murein transglycosylase D